MGKLKNYIADFFSEFLEKFIAAVAIVFAVLNFAFIFIYFFPFYQLPESKIFTIAPGTSLSQIAITLENEAILDNKFLFKSFVKLQGKSEQIKAGEYLFKGKFSLYDVIYKLTHGKTHQRYITILEGMTIKQIKEFLGTTVLKGRITKDYKEGHLMPDTYAYTPSMTKNEFLERMAEEMDKFLTKVWDQRDSGLPFDTKEEVLTLASIVEKETPLDHEKPIVAAVFINRLKKGMRLQADPTVVYAVTNKLGDMEGRQLLRRHLQIDSPYNTYRNKGLPPTPIANPGRDSIKAVLHPADRKYLYFVADGKGGHYFSNTLKQHTNYRIRWQRIRDDYNLREVLEKRETEDKDQKIENE